MIFSKFRKSVCIYKEVVNKLILESKNYTFFFYEPRFGNGANRILMRASRLSDISGKKQALYRENLLEIRK